MTIRTILVRDEPWGEHDQQIRTNGWVVANAPRPLVGPLTWTGEFRRGVFYAAGPDSPAQLAAWGRDDAVLLAPADPAQVVEKLREVVAEHGYDLTTIATDDPDMVAVAAEDFDLPWDDAWLPLILGGGQ